MKKVLILWLLDILFSLKVQAITLQTPLPGAEQIQLSTDTIIDRLWQQTNFFPNEKIHLHTDRSVYAGGDTIWFRAYLVNALDNRPETASRYIYSELIDPFGNSVSRVKIKQDKDSLFYGYLSLIDDLPSGEYVLRAYTRYMENDGDEFFFHKPIHVVSPLSKSLSTKVSYEGEPLQKQIKGLIGLTNTATQEAISMKNVSVYNENGLIEHWTEGKQCQFKFSPDKYKHKVVKLEAANFQQFLPVLLSANDYHVDFLPEGGNLPVGVLSKMAFKALNTSGLSEEITGTVKDESGKEICAFQTQHAGMGCFSWVPEAGKKYYAECTSKAGVTRRFDLPVPQTNVYTLNIQENRGTYHISILSAYGTLPADTFALLIHQRGFPLFAQSFYQTGLIRIEKKVFAPGIIQMLLLSSQGAIVSERLVFVKNHKQTSVIVQTDKESYGQREKVILSVALQDAENTPIQGNLSISVTDNTDLLPDSSYTIYSSLLLSSDLKGYIEDPGWYFQGNDNEQTKGLDLLMMTQGWRRYNMENALTADYKRPTLQPETSQILCGSVKRLVGNKAIANAKVQIHIPTQKILEEINANEEGKFEFDHFEFPDSTMYNIQATTKKNGKNVLLSLDTVTFPKVDQIWPFHSYTFPNTANNAYSNLPATVEFLDKANRRMTYENGMRNIFLEDVVVTAPKKVNKTPYESILGVLTFREEEIKKTSMQDLPTFLQSRLPGLMFTANGFMHEDAYIHIILNGFPIYDKKLASLTLSSLRIQDIEQIDYNRHGKDGLAWFPMTGAKFIAITLKDKIEPYDYMPKNIQQVLLPGHQKPAAFYSPKYDTPQSKNGEAPDLRTTIYWQPNLQTNEQGSTFIEFYTADGNTPYSVVIEGITQKNELVRTVKAVMIGE